MIGCSYHQGEDSLFEICMCTVSDISLREVNPGEHKKKKTRIVTYFRFPALVTRYRIYSDMCLYVGVRFVTCVCLTTGCNYHVLEVERRWRV